MSTSKAVKIPERLGCAPERGPLAGSEEKEGRVPPGTQRLREVRDRKTALQTEETKSEKGMKDSYKESKQRARQ